MIRRFSTLGLLAALALTATSCKENPELVRKREEQRTEIKKLEGELAILDEKLKDVPPDHSAELAKAKVDAEAQSANIARTEKDVADLEVRKRELEKSFADYRQKYPVKAH